MENAVCLIEVIAAVLPPEVQMTAPCGRTEMHVNHPMGDKLIPDVDAEHCMGVPLQPTGWTRNRHEHSHTRVWALTSTEWNGGDEIGRRRLAEKIAMAQEYARELMLSHGFNHVQTTWLWL